MLRFMKTAAAAALALLAAGAAFAAPPEDSRAPDEAVIGVIDVNEPGYRSEFVSPTLIYLSKSLPEYRLRTVEIPAYRAAETIRQTSPDFVIGPSDIFLTLINSSGAQTLVSRKTPYAINAGYSVGSALIVREDRKELKDLADLKGKSVAASLPDSLGGWLALMGEVKRSGYRPEAFFGSTRFLTFQFPDVMQSVLEGQTDAGVLSACQLEAAEKAGLIDPGKLRVIHKKEDRGELRCQRSTALYPDQQFGVISYTRPELVRRVAAALLAMPPQPSFSWQVTGQFNAVNDLFKTLEIGPYEPRPWTLADFCREYLWEIGAVLALIAGLLLNEVRLRRLVVKRTAALSESLEENKRLSEVERRSRERLSVLERNSMVSHMSSMIAHELKQPLAAIINYCEVARLRLEDMDPAEPRLEQVNSLIAREANRITAIVDRVRSYAKKKNAPHAPCDLYDVMSRALANFRQHQVYRDAAPEVAASAERAECIVSGDSLELEILVLNLLKNAARAVKGVKKPRIWVKLEPEGPYCRLSVRDNGPRLTDEEFRRLHEASDSTNPDGLGLGLSIVRGIADSNGARLQVTRLDPCGVEFALEFERLAEKTGWKVRSTDTGENPS